MQHDQLRLVGSLAQGRRRLTLLIGYCYVRRPFIPRETTTSNSIHPSMPSMMLYTLLNPTSASKLTAWALRLPDRHMTSSVSSGFGDLLHAGDKIREEAHGELPFSASHSYDWAASGMFRAISA